MISSFIEKESRHSSFIRLESTSALDDVASKLVDLRVELTRNRPGMSDFIIRISSPKLASLKSNTVLSIRGDRSFSGFDKVKDLAACIGAEMQKRGDKTYLWANLDVDHLANMLASSLKYFVQRPSTVSLQLVTEALS